MVARFHHSGKDENGTHRNRRLEILPVGQDIVDLIVITFVYALKEHNEGVGKAGHGPGAPYTFSKSGLAEGQK
jgi:hypothetical protein